MTIERPFIKIQKLSEGAIVPRYANRAAAGFDLYSITDGILKAGERLTLPIGIASEISPCWCVLFVGKSGLASKKGIDILGGLIDSDYRGEWKVVLLNSGEEDYDFQKGDKITQGVILYSPQASILEVDKLS